MSKNKYHVRLSKDGFLTKKGTILSSRLLYLADFAFQKYVFMKAFPNQAFSAYLMMVDKTALCTTDGLNQKFKIGKDADGHLAITFSPSLSI